MEKNPGKQTVLVVDDSPENIDVLVGILNRDYKVKAATTGEKAIKIAKSQNPPDLILLDIMMPDMDGYEVCWQLKASAMTRRIPIIFVTAKGEVEDETRGFELGAVDYITKPVSPPIVKARVRTHLALYHQNQVLAEKVKERTRELSHTQDVTILGLAILAEYRDNETGGHIRRTQNYIRMLAEHLLTYPKFRDYLDYEIIDSLYKSTPLHDIGKVGVPDRILLKPGKLTSEEFEEMKKHTIYGHDAIMKAEEALGNNRDTSFLRFAREIAYTHHEKWDGSGYPQGLAGEDIPLSGRLMAVIDVYDALISKRVYKSPLPHKKAVAIMLEGRGIHFDPDLIDVFLELEDKFRQIALQYADHEEERVMLSDANY